MDFLKTVAGKIVAGGVGLAVVAGGISWWQMDPETRHGLIHGTGRICAWFGIVAIVPWASFFLIGWVARFEKNSAGAILILAYTILEAILLAWLFGFRVGGVMAWTFFASAVLLAGVYNLFTCDWLAEKQE